MSNIVINIPLGQKVEGKVAKVIVGSNTFEAPVESRDLERLGYQCIEISQTLENTNDLKTIKKALKKAYNATLGDGAFKKVFAESGSLIECTEVLLQVTEQLTAQMPQPTQAQKAQQFAKQKKNKKK